MNENPAITRQSLLQCGPRTQNLAAQLLTPARVRGGSPLSITPQWEEASQLLSITVLKPSVPKRCAEDPPKLTLLSSQWTTQMKKVSGGTALTVN